MSAISVVESALGDELGPDLIANIGHVPPETLERLAHEYRRFAQEGANPVSPSAPDELTPFITLQAMRCIAAEFDPRLNPSLTYNFVDPATPEIIEDTLKRFLLYCHRLVVDDPLIYTMDYLAFGAPLEEPLWRRVLDRLTGCLTLLSYLRPTHRARHRGVRATGPTGPHLSRTQSTGRPTREHRRFQPDRSGVRRLSS